MEAIRKKLFKSNDEDANIGEDDLTINEESLSFEIGDSEDEIKINF